MSSGKVFLGLVAGFATGALLGVLFAPDKGSETRKKISKKGSDVIEDLREKFDDLLENLAESLETFKGKESAGKTAGNTDGIKNDTNSKMN